MPISASPNSTRPRSSSRLTIDRARNSICRMLVAMGAAILKHHLGAERTGCKRVPDRLIARDGCDVRGVELGWENIVTIDAENVHRCAVDRREQCDGGRRAR